MKKNVKFFIGGLIGAVLIVGVYFGVNGGLFQGKLEKDGPITRVELLEMIAPVLATKLDDNLKDCTDTPFFDVTTQTVTLRQVKAVCYLTKMGIIAGYANGSFKPAANISRAEAAKLFWEVFSTAGGDVGKSWPDPAYTDIGSEGYYWFYDFIQQGAGVKTDVGVGYFDIDSWAGKKFFPSNYLTKGRAKVWIKNLSKALDSF